MQELGLLCTVHMGSRRHQTSGIHHMRHVLCTVPIWTVCRKKYSLINAWSLLRKLSIHNFQRFHELGIHWTCLKGDRPASEDHDPIHSSKNFFMLKMFQQFFFLWTLTPRTSCDTTLKDDVKTKNLHPIYNDNQNEPTVR